MPWHIGKSAECDGFAVIKDADDSVSGCHDTREEAEAQMAALYASEAGESESSESAVEQARALIEQALKILSTMVRDGKVEQSDLDKAALYGIPWEAYLGMDTTTTREGESMDEPSTLNESATGHVIAIEEAEVHTGKLTPLTLDVAIIEPGPGNAKDGHYYPKEVLRRDAGVFKGAKMFASDHRELEKSVGTWVSTIKSCPVGFTESGAPIARVVVHKDWFANDILSLRDAGLLNRMECSILGSGKARKGKIGEIQYNIVEAITSTDSVDWVTRAGAGGRALALAESDAPTQVNGGEDVDENEQEVVQEVADTVTLREEDEPTGEQPQESPPEPETTEEPQATEEEPESIEAALSADAVNELLKESGLGEDAQRLLSVGAYKTGEAVQGAIAEFKRIIKQASGSGRPFAQGAANPAPQVQITEADRVKRYAEIKAKHGLNYPLSEVK